MVNLKTLLIVFDFDRKRGIYDSVVITELLAIRQQFFTSRQKHNVYLMPFSLWPFLTFVAVLVTVIGFVMYLHSYQYGFLVFVSGFLFLLTVFFCWCNDVVREAVVFRVHSRKVQQGFRYGMLLFIASEVMFFFAFF
jgi:hypothetical protein